MDANANQRKQVLEWIAIGVALASDRRLDPARFSMRTRQLVVSLMDETKPTTDPLEVDIGVTRKEPTSKKETKRALLIDAVLEEIGRLSRNIELKRLAMKMACASVAGDEIQKLATAMETRT